MAYNELFSIQRLVSMFDSQPITKTRPKKYFELKYLKYWITEKFQHLSTFDIEKNNFSETVGRTEFKKRSLKSIFRALWLRHKYLKQFLFGFCIMQKERRPKTWKTPHKNIILAPRTWEICIFNFKFVFSTRFYIGNGIYKSFSKLFIKWPSWD